MDPYNPAHQIQRLSRRNPLFNARRNDGVDFYNLHVIPTSIPLSQTPSFYPSVQPDLTPVQEPEPTPSRTVSFNSHKKSRKNHRSGVRPNLIDVRSISKTDETIPVSSSVVKINISEVKHSDPFFVKRTESPYKSYYPESRSQVSRTSSKSRSPIVSRNHYESKSPRSSSSLESSHYFKSREEHRSGSHYSYYYSPRKNHRDEKHKAKEDYFDKLSVYKPYEQKRTSHKESHYKKEASKKTSATVQKNIDCEKVETVSREVHKESEVPVGFRNCKVRYLHHKKCSFFKPKIYYICPERTVINCLNVEEEEEWKMKDDDGDLVLEEEYEMETGEETAAKDGEITSEKNKNDVEIGNNNEEASADVSCMADPELSNCSSKTDVDDEAYFDELITSSRSYRICIPDLPEFYQGEAIIQPDIDAWTSHLIGLSYLLEIRDKSDDTNILQHHCVLCDVDIHAENDSGEMVIDHISSYTHMFKYLEKHFQSCGFNFSEKKENFNNKIVLQKCCEEICSKLGYDCISVTDDDYYAKNIHNVLKTINCVPHRCETDININALSYMKDVENDISKTVTSVLNDIVKELSERTIKMSCEVKKSSSEETSKSKLSTQKANKLKTDISSDPEEKSKTVLKKDKIFSASRVPPVSLFSFGISEMKKNKKGKRDNPKVKNDQSCHQLQENKRPVADEDDECEIIYESNPKSNTLNTSSNKKEKNGESVKNKSKKLTFNVSKDAFANDRQNIASNSNESVNVSINEEQNKNKHLEPVTRQTTITVINDQKMKNPELQISPADKSVPKSVHPEGKKTFPNSEESVSNNRIKNSLTVKEQEKTKKDNQKSPVVDKQNVSNESLKDALKIGEKEKAEMKQNSVSTLKKMQINKIPVFQEQKITTIVEMQKSPATFKTKNMGRNRIQKNLSNLKVLKEVATLSDTLTTPCKVMPANTLIKKEITQTSVPVTNMKTNNSESNNNTINSISQIKVSNSIQRPVTLKNEQEIEPPIAPSLSETSAKHSILKEKPVIQDSTSDFQINFPENSLKISEQEPVVEKRSSSKDKCGRHKHHSKTTTHSKYCIKRILSRTKIINEASEIDDNSTSKSIELSDNSYEAKVISNSEINKRKSFSKRSDESVRHLSPSRTRRISISPPRKSMRLSPKRRSRSPGKSLKNPLHHHSPSSVMRYERSPVRKHSKSPLRRLSRSPLRQHSRSPIRRLSRSPLRRHSRSPLGRHSRSPFRRHSRSPYRKHSRSPLRRFSRSPVRKHSRSPFRTKSRSPRRRRSRSPIRRESRSPIRRLSRSPSKRYGRSPVHKHSRSPVRRLSRSPIRKRSRSPLWRELRKRSRSPIHRDISLRRPLSRNSPLRSSYRKHSESEERNKFSSYQSGSRSPQRRRSRSFSPPNESLSHNQTKRSGRIYDPLMKKSARDYNKSSSASDLKQASDLDSISDEDESTYFNTSDKPQHLEEIMKLPEPTRSLISQMFKKFLSTSKVNPDDSSLLKFMQFMNAQSDELQEIIGSRIHSNLGGASVTSTKMSAIPHLKSSSHSRPQMPLNTFNQISSQFHSLSPAVPPHFQQPTNLPSSSFSAPTFPSHSPMNIPPPTIPSLQQRPHLSIPSQNPSVIPFQNEFQQVRSNIAPDIMFKDLKARVHMLFGAEENKVKQSTTEKVFSLGSGNSSSKQLNFNPSIMSPSYLKESRVENYDVSLNAPKFSDLSVPQNIFSSARSDADFRGVSNSSSMARDNFFPEHNPITMYNENILNPVSQHKVAAPPPDAKVSFCAGSPSSAKKNLFPVLNNPNSNFSHSSSQGNVSEVKKSLAQRLAAVLVKVGMIDVPAPLLQEMLMKIGAFSSCPPQDIRETEILDILRRLGYVS